MKRHNARIITILSLYNIDVSSLDETALEECFENIKNIEMEQNLEIEIDYEYAFKMLKGVFQNLSTIDEIIKKVLVNYTIDRLSYVDRAIIRLAVYEMKYEKLPRNVVIDEALLITHDYSNLDDGAQVKFNNRLLDNIAKEIYE